MGIRFNGIDYDNPRITLSYVQGYFHGKNSKDVSSIKEAEDGGKLLARNFDCPSKGQHWGDFYKGYMDAVEEFNLIKDTKMRYASETEDLLAGIETLKTLDRTLDLYKIFVEYYYNKDFLKELREKYVPNDDNYGAIYFYNKLGLIKEPRCLQKNHSLIALLMNRAWKLYDEDREP